MIYYNDSVILDESGFDVVDALMECPIYDRYNDMIQSISEFGFISESEKIEFRILEENVFETIGNALKKAWDAIAKFFSGLAGKIKGFFEKISMKKIKTAVDKNIKKKEEEMQEEVKEAKQTGRLSDPEEKEKLRKKFGLKVDKFEKDDNGNYTNFACLDSNKLVKETVNTGGYKKFKQMASNMSKFFGLVHRIRNKEEADKQIRYMDQVIKIDDSCKTMKIPSNEVKNKINECMQISKLNSLISNGDGYLVPKDQKALSDYLFGLSDFSLQENRSMTKLYTDIANLAADMSKKYEGAKSIKKNSGYADFQNRYWNGYMKKSKDLLTIINQDKGGLNQITNATLKAYKDAAIILMKFGSKTQKDSLKKDGIDISDDGSKPNERLKNNNESYDPWAGLEESYDPWDDLW